MSRTGFNPELWHEGDLQVGKTNYHYWAKVYDEGSEWGINEGRISKLMIKQDSKIVCNYDRGWDVEPKKGSSADKALQQVLNIYKG